MSEQANIKRYTVKEPWKDYSVTLEVDHSILSPDHAELINNFWGDHKYRVAAEKGDVVRAVIRLAGSTMIRIMLDEGGTSFTEKPSGPVFNDNPGPLWTKDLHDQEGWGGTVKGNPYGWCGIRVIAADIEALGFDDFELEEVANG
ncbi:hypothetical protein C4K19_0409 [Pseudomonas chlororaphis subsp. aurantiaca]|uniref:DUF2528 family protein n=1 Tax=Pseudomonas chlororaphis TaxID=587753 RepID=UPI000F577D24|nr:DUF2528 family protein [Pseudomonas chlororaphis]AZD52227.1 hypothetical protein C4K19_0409 [Pseudomonas chlororaphis subsp. aurantiaca]